MRFIWLKRQLLNTKFFYRESLNCLIIFVVAAYIGYIAAVLLQGQALEYYNQVREFILARPFSEEVPKNLFLFILARNSLVSFTALVLGIFTYNVWPIMILLLNGAISGFVVKLQAIIFNHYTFQIWLFGILPHGVPELSALFLTCGASFYYRKLRVKGEFIWNKVLSTYFLIVLPLLVLAAMIESNLTPLLIKYFLV